MLNSVPQDMPLELLAITPPIVQAASLAGSGPEPAAVPGQPRVDLPDGRAGLDADPPALVEDLDAAEVPAGVEQQRLRRRLPGQARAAGAEGDRHALLREQPASARPAGRCR